MRLCQVELEMIWLQLLINSWRKLKKAKPFLKRIILWSDSCVDQKFIDATALEYFVDQETANGHVIEQKFQEPGHRSTGSRLSTYTLERHFRGFEFHRPLAVARSFAK